MARKATAAKEEPQVKSLGDWFEEFTDQGLEKDEIVWETITNAEDEAFIPAIAGYYSVWERNKTRADEQQYEDALSDADVEEQPGPTKRSKPRRMVNDQAPVVRHFGLLGRTFYNGSQKVRYSDATVADLQARIDYLQDKVDGYQRTIALTKRLITMMKRAKVDTLGDINPESLAQIWAEMKDAGEIA